MKFNRCFGCMEEIPGYPCHNCGFDPTQTTAPNYVLPYGTILDGRYLVGNMLGRGGFGITYIGFDLMLQRKVAIKEYYPSGQVSRITTISTDLQWLDSEQPDQLREKGIRSCLREARKMAKIGDIPEVVRVLECFQENDTAYIVMDYVDGKTLMSVLREQGPMTWDQAKGIFLPAISAMEEVHQAGMVHRDISPDNLMLTKKGVRILDLGAAKDLGINNGASSELVVKGGFSPLEQYAHQGGSGPWTDVYAMAATMYHCLTGVIPPSAVDRSQGDTMDWALLKARGVPNHVITALQNAMKLTVRERTQSMAELLSQCRSNSTGRSKPKPVPEPEASKTQPPVTEAPVHKIKKRNDSVFNHLRKNGNSKSIGFTIGFAIAFCAVVAVLVMFFMNGNVRKDPSQPTDYNPIGSKPVAENPWIENVLMSDEAPEWIVYNGYDAFVMGSDIPRKQIQSITFLDTLKDAPTDSWDVSENGDGSVLAWVTNGSELFFGANGGINAKYCKGLFYGYYNVSEINFNHCFHTDFATNMASMFDFCPALSVLDVSDFNTANVTDMSGMFYDCSSLTRIDLSGFDTSKVTGMSCMFTNCCKITSLDLSSFDTSNVTSMSWMFYKCLTLSNLVIDGFCTTNVTDMGNMFFECPKLETINGIEGFDTRNVVNHDDFMEPGKLVNGHRWEELFAGSENGNVVTEKHPIAVDGGEKHSVVLYSDGTVTTIGDDTYGQRGTSGWRDIVQISTFSNHTLGLRLDGTVVAAGANKEGQCDVLGWSDIVAVAAGSRHSVGVKRDGTVVATGSNSSGQCDVEKWNNVKYVAANSTSTFGLTNDGKVLVCGSFYNQNLTNWSDIISISVSANHVVGVHSDGTVSAVGSNDKGQRDGLETKGDVVQVAAGYGFTAGLKNNGKVWVNGCDEHNEHAAMQWTDIVAIGTGMDHILGIKKDGTLVAKGANEDGQCDVYPINQLLETKTEE